MSKQEFKNTVGLKLGQLIKYQIWDLLIEKLSRKYALEASSSPYLISVNKLTQQTQVKNSFLDKRFCMGIIENLTRYYFFHW